MGSHLLKSRKSRNKKFCNLRWSSQYLKQAFSPLFRNKLVTRNRFTASHAQHVAILKIGGSKFAKQITFKVQRVRKSKLNQQRSLQTTLSLFLSQSRNFRQSKKSQSPLLKSKFLSLFPCSVRFYRLLCRMQIREHFFPCKSHKHWASLRETCF